MRADRPNFGPVSSASHATHTRKLTSFTLLIGAIDRSVIETDAKEEGPMSERNGDRARFQKNRKRKLRHRQRVQEFVKALRAQPLTPIGQDKATGRS